MKFKNDGNAEDAQQKIAALNGLVLCGGKGTRMGKDKSEINYHDKSQRKYLYEILSAHCKAVFISCNAEQSKHITDVRIIKDVYLNEGPLGGILSAFQHNLKTAWLAVACDLPFLNNETITYLVNHRNPLKMATAFLSEEKKFIEPLITIWEPCAFPVLTDRFKRGYKSPGKILSDSDVELINAPDKSVFKNVNTIDEYRVALELIHKLA